MLIRTTLSKTNSIIVHVTKSGRAGREIELRSAGTAIEWRYVGASNWTLLFDVGVILPRGGGTDQVLAKLSNLDYDYAWKSTNATDKHYVESFTNQNTITVTHNMGKYPSVTVINSAGDEVIGDIEHISVNQLTASFSSGFSGKITCN